MSTKVVTIKVERKSLYGVASEGSWYNPKKDGNVKLDSFVVGNEYQMVVTPGKKEKTFIIEELVSSISSTKKETPKQIESVVSDVDKRQVSIKLQSIMKSVITTAVNYTPVKEELSGVVKDLTSKLYDVLEELTEEKSR
jgi:hypothetical protein